MTKQTEIFNYLDTLAELIPSNLYWLNLEQQIIGINQKALNTIGSLSREEVIGKTWYELHNKHIADNLSGAVQKVISTKKEVKLEYIIKDVNNANSKYFLDIISPLFDTSNLMIGIVGASFDITNEKEENQLKIKKEQLGFEKTIRQLRQENVFDSLEIISSIIPASFYWLDRKNILLGANDVALKAIGIAKEYAIGKSAYDVYPQYLAEKIILHNEEVMSSGAVSSQEETIQDINTGEIKYFTAIKSPLKDISGEIIGLVGVSIEITAEKKAEQLQIENEKQKSILEEQEKFKRDVDQIVHDIRSPLTSLDMLAKYNTSLPEADRNDFRNIATSISDIANNLLSKYNSKNNKYESEEERTDAKQPVLVSLILRHLLSDKKYQYKHYSVVFELQIEQDWDLTFINVQPTSLRRSLSNIINNAVDSLDGKEGKVIIRLENIEEKVRITISDNGKGMPPAVREKILNSIAVTNGKENGHGIGMSQVLGTLERNSGMLEIDSIINCGTSISITFARVAAPDWIVTEINLNKDDLLVVLDDDNSIHKAWDARLEVIHKDNPDIKVIHFKLGHEALEFIDTLSEEDRKKVFLLSDYELLQQKINGLDIIKRAQISRSILVTSHYNDIKVRHETAKLNTKILPKQLASEILIKIDNIKNSEQQNVQIEKSQTDTQFKIVDLVLVDDDKMLISNYARYLFKHMIVDFYFSPDELLDNLFKYSKDTKIAIDYHYHGSSITGVDVARILYDKGYTNLYILSGNSPEKIACGGIATAILKTDLDLINKYLSKPI